MYKTGEEVYDELSKMTPEQRKCLVYQAAWSDKDISSIINDKLKTEQLDPEVKAEYEELLKFPDVLAGMSSCAASVRPSTMTRRLRTYSPAYASIWMTSCSTPRTATTVYGRRKA